jgi:hypothetical protein
MHAHSLTRTLLGMASTPSYSLAKDSTRISPRFERHTDYLPYPLPSVVPPYHQQRSQLPDSGDNFVPNLPIPHPETAVGPDYPTSVWSPPQRVPIIPPSVASESTDLIRTPDAAAPQKPSCCDPARRLELPGTDPLPS